jgi:octaprenyl-diphosphate synthase
MRVRNNKSVTRATSVEDAAILFSTIEQELSQVRSFMVREATASIKSVNALVEHVTAKSGKMLRSGLLLLSGKACGGIKQEHIEVGGIVELVHTATLLHDDVLDSATNRRGAETVNLLWGNECAVLLGDFLLSRAFVVGSRLAEPRVGQVISETAVQICRGELRQNLERRNWELSREEYYEIIRDKTAALFGSCCYLGGLVSGADENQLERLSEFGLNVGMAFQLTDDLMDIISDENSMGKTAGKDFLQGKLTLPVIHCLDGARKNDRADLIEKISGESGRKVLHEILEGSGSIDCTRAEAERFADKAVLCLKNIGDGEVKRALVETAKFSASRCG